MADECLFCNFITFRIDFQVVETVLLVAKECSLLFYYSVPWQIISQDKYSNCTLNTCADL